MRKELILKEIYDQNRHWKNDLSFFEEKEHKRKLFFELTSYLKERQIVSVYGIRRTGKTILLKQLIRYLVEEEKVDIKDILFLSFDEALLASKLTLKNYLDAYIQDIAESSRRKYIFIDEIQYVKKWQHILKRYYDSNLNIKFVISGSSSLFLKKKTTESLAGRIYEFKLNYLSFEEFLEISEVSNVILEKYRKYSVKTGFVFEKKNFKKINKNYHSLLAQYGKDFQKLFEDYILYRQFPEMAKQIDKEKIKKYLSNSIYRKTIEYDIPRIFGVDKIDELRFIYQMLINENGNILEYQTIAGEAGVEENTLKKYLYYFQESFLLDIIYNYSKSFRKSKRLQKKGYIVSANFYAADYSERFEDSMLFNQYFGMLAENYIFHLLKNNFSYISFFKKEGKEIDFVAGNNVLNKNSLTLFEVKYINQIKKEDFSFLDKISKKTFKKSPCFIFTKNTFEIQENKVFIPCFLLR